MNDIPYLKTHSYFGFLESLSSPEDLVDLAVKNEIHTLGLTDHRYLTGSIVFYESCKNAGIKPIIGLEIDLNYKGYKGLLTLLAKNNKGWRSLSHLSSLMLVENRPSTPENLSEYCAGLICIAGDQRGILREIILKSRTSQNLAESFIKDLFSLFQEDFFIEIQRYSHGPLKIEKIIRTLAEDCNIPLIASQNIFYGQPSEYAHYRTLYAIQQNITLSNLDKGQNHLKHYHFPGKDEFIHRFDDIPEALENLKLISEKCNLSLPIGKKHYPKFKTPSNVTQSEYLREKAFQGAKKNI